MARAWRIERVRRWVLPLLVVTLVLGHACELPALVPSHEAAAGAAAAGHPHPYGHAHGEGTSGDEALACEATVVISGVSVAVHAVVATAVPVPDRIAAARPLAPVADRQPRPPGPAPLFVLFSSFLI